MMIPSPKTRRWTLNTDNSDPLDVVCVQIPGSSIKSLLGTVSGYVEAHDEEYEGLSLTFQGELSQIRTHNWEMKGGKELPPAQWTVPKRPEYQDYISMCLDYARVVCLLLDLAKHLASDATSPLEVTFTGKLTQEWPMVINSKEST